MSAQPGGNPTSGVISEAIDLYRAHFGHLFIIAFVIYVALALIGALLAQAGGVLAGLAAALVSVIGLFLVQAALIEAVNDIRDGRADQSVGETLRNGSSHIASVAGASIIAAIGIAIGFVLLI